MKFIISSGLLSKQLQHVSKVVSTSSPMAILENFLVELKPGEIKFTASDLESSICATITNFETESTGSFTVPAKNLTDLIKTFPDQPLTFSIETEGEEAKRMTITSNQGDYNFPCMSSTDFPALGDNEWTSEMSLHSHELNKAITNTANITTSTSRAAFSGVLFEDEENLLNIVASDIHRLSRISCQYTQAPSTPLRYIVPKKPLTTLSSILAELDDEKEVEIKANQTAVFFKTDQIEMTSRLVNDDFPVYQNAVPDNNPFKLTIDCSAIMSSLKRLSIFASKNNHLITLNIKGMQLKIVAEDTDLLKKAEETINCQYEGEDFEISFNSKHVTDLLSMVESDDVNISFSAPNKPAIIKEMADSDEVMDNRNFMMLTPLLGS